MSPPTVVLAVAFFIGIPVVGVAAYIYTRRRNRNEKPWPYK